MNQQFFICDIDNCISDDRSRIPLIDWHQTDLNKRYAAYHEAFERDFPHEPSCEIVRRRIQQGQTPLYITGRPEAFRKGTIEWLQRHNLLLIDPGAPVCVMLMRPNGNTDGSVELKKHLLAGFRERRGKGVWIDHAYDDREDIVQMYRDSGLSASVLKCHSVDAYAPPKRDWLREALPGVSASADNWKAAVEAQRIKLSIGYHEGKDDPKPAPARDAADILATASKTYRERNAVYGDNYKHFGKVMKGLFPRGLHVESIDDWNRLGVLVQVASKLSRYAQNFSAGGHVDSAHDAAVYAAILQELTEDSLARREDPGAGR
jgi:hypothetical protein